MTTQKIETYLPVFPGFYNTLYEFRYNGIEDDIAEERRQNGLFSGIDLDDIEINYKAYETDIVTKYAKILKEEFSDFVIEIKLQKIVSPKEYNFYNDSADVEITVDTEKIKEFIYSNKEKFTEFLQKRYTSYDGFISRYSNSFEEWEVDTKEFSDFTIDGHRLGSILDFISQMLKINDDDLYYDVSGDIYEGNYVTNYNELINKQDGTLYEFFTSKGIIQSLADYYYTIYKNGNLKEYNLPEHILNTIKEYENNLV